MMLCSGFLSSCNPGKDTVQPKEEKIANILDKWHLAATNADLESYFAPLAKNAIYIGTDPGERWTKDEFYQFSKPYFDKGKAWDFKAFDRQVYFAEDGQTAWFNELLNTWMGVCRGSGVLVKKEEGWKIIHYHLSVTVKNENVREFLTIEKDTIKE
jgi:ketosteroid isomerase-like protein